MRWPKKGFTVCRFCGGSAPQVIAAAERRLQRQAGEEAVATYGLPIDIDPQQALLAEVRRTYGHVAWLADVVASIDREALVWGVSEETSGHDGSGDVALAKRTAAPNVWLDLYRRERKHLVEVCRAAIASGIEERRLQMEEAHGDLLAGVLTRSLAALREALAAAGVAPPVLAQVLDVQAREIVHAELLAVAAAADDR